MSEPTANPRPDPFDRTATSPPIVNARPKARPESRPKARLGWVDYAKGMGIFLVVLGHALRAFPDAIATSGIPAYLKTLDVGIYSFHMPLFFILSGLFLPSSSSQSPQTFLTKKLATILYPYLLWSLLYGALKAFTSPDISIQADLLALHSIPWHPIEHYWFLCALFSYSLLYLFLSRLPRGPWLFLGITVALYSTHIAGISLETDLLHRMRVNGLYLALGCILPILGGFKAFTWPEATNDRQRGLSHLGLALLGLATIIVGVHLNLTTHPLAQPILALAGSTSVISLSILLDRYPILPMIQRWGQWSLQIYLIHMIPMLLGRTLVQKIWGLQQVEALVVVMTCAGLWGSIALIGLADRLPIPNLFTWAVKPAKTS